MPTRDDDTGPLTREHFLKRHFHPRNPYNAITYILILLAILAFTAAFTPFLGNYTTEFVKFTLLYAVIASIIQTVKAVQAWRRDPLEATRDPDK